MTATLTPAEQTADGLVIHFSPPLRRLTDDEFFDFCMAKRSPDLSWVRVERWEALTETGQEKFPPLCPDFVVELRSPSDSLRHLRQKMEEYVENGAQLGWLIDPFERKVHVYRPHTSAEVLDDPEAVSGEPPLRGFALDVRALFE